MDLTLQTLLDEREVERACNRLFIHTDERDWVKVREYLTADVHFDMSSAGVGDPSNLSPDEMIALWDSGLRDLQAVHHQTGNYLIDINGDEANAFCYGMASHYLPHPTGRNTRTFVGCYDFHLVRSGSTWKFDSIKFSLKYTEGNLQLR